MSSPQITWDEPKIEWDDHADALARSAKPTQFERERDPSRQPGVTQSLLSEVGDAIKSVPDIIRGTANPATTARRGAALFEHDQDRAATRSPAYRAVADVGEAAGINAPGMEHDADIGNRRGIVGKATGDALMLTGPSAIHTGFEAARGRFPNYKAPEPRSFDADRAFNRTAIGGMIDLLGPSPTVGKAAAAAGTGLATEAVPWLVNKAARSKPVVDFMTKRPGPGAGEGRVPLWKQAGIQEGRGEPGSNVQVTNVPEPTPRPRRTPPPLESEVQAARDDTGPIHEIKDAPENLRPKSAPPTGDPVSRVAGETKNLAADMEQPSELPRGKTPENPAASNRLEADMSEDEIGPEIPGALTTKRQAAPYDTSKGEIPGVKSPDSVAHKALSDLGFEPRNFDIENVRATTGGDVDEHEATADYIWDHMMGEPSWLDPDDMAEHLRSGKQLDDQGILDLAKKKITSSPKPTADEVKKFTQERDTDIPRGLSSDEYDRIDEEDERIGPYVDAVEQFGQKTVDSWFARPSKGPKPLPISDTAKDAFQRFVKSKGKEGPLAPPKPKGISRRSDMQDDQAVRQEIEQRTQVRPREPGRKGKAELADEFKRGKRMDINVDVASKSLTDRLKELPDLWADEGVDADSMLRPADPRLLAEIEQFKKETGRKTAPIKEFNKWRDKKK
jgi:hypothetical protein